MSGLFAVFIIAASLALDAMSVSIAGGINAKRPQVRDALKVALFFGVFQAVMPLIGWTVGLALQNVITGASKWIAFVLLVAIGLKMIYEAFQNESKNKIDIRQTKTLIVLAIATSIDALVVGLTLHVANIPLLISVVIIGIVTFALSLLGFLFGNKLGTFVEGNAEVIGGIALIAIGAKVLLF